MMKKILIIAILALLANVSIAQNQKLNSENLYITYGNSQFVKSIAKMELVSEETYLAQKAKRINFMDSSANKIRKIKGVINLPCKNRTLTFKDSPKNDESYAEYSYTGQIDFMNVFVLGYNLYQTSGYSFIDRTTGEEVESFEEYPYISPDKKHIVVVRQDAIDVSASISFYDITKEGVEMTVSDNFENWTPYLAKEIFWTTNNALYIPVVQIDNYNANEDASKFCQYIKLTLLK